MAPSQWPPLVAAASQGAGQAACPDAAAHGPVAGLPAGPAPGPCVDAGQSPKQTPGVKLSDLSPWHRNLPAAKVMTPSRPTGILLQVEREVTHILNGMLSCLRHHDIELISPSPPNGLRRGVGPQPAMEGHIPCLHIHPQTCLSWAQAYVHAGAPACSRMAGPAAAKRASHRAQNE